MEHVNVCCSFTIIIIITIAVYRVRVVVFVCTRARLLQYTIQLRNVRETMIIANNERALFLNNFFFHLLRPPPVRTYTRMYYICVTRGARVYSTERRLRVYIILYLSRNAIIGCSSCVVSAAPGRAARQGKAVQDDLRHKTTLL